MVGNALNTQRAAESENPARVIPLGGWQHLADGLARYGWMVLLGSIAVGFVGGVMVTIWQPDDSAGATPGPGVRDLPMIILMLGYLMLILLGGPSLLASTWDFLRGRWAGGGCWCSSGRCCSSSAPR